MVNIQIPKAYFQGFQSLASLPTEQISSIVAFLKEIPVGSGVNSFTLLFDQTFPDLETKGIAQTIYSLASFSVSDLELTHDDLVNELLISFKDQMDDSNETPQLIEGLKRNLLQIFQNIDKLESCYKVFNLLSENSKVLKTAHIITDIRLVFKDNLQENDRNALIIHRLKLKSEEGEVEKEDYFSLDTTDLKKLKEQIERAEEKERLIREQYLDVFSFITITD